VNLQQHAKAITAAIQAAHDEGYELDNGEGMPLVELDLNKVENGRIGDWAAITLPVPTY
jgi:hypothetical protein